MGKLEQGLVVKHFSHEHPLQLVNRNRHPCMVDTESTTPCAGCNLQLSGWVYGCQACDYYIDITCSQLPRRINHGAHPVHTLSLYASPVYPEGSFDCDACGLKGTGFCFHCDDCELDLHVTCAARPLLVVHGGHSHPLVLTISSPYGGKGFMCDVCRRPGSSRLWSYRCDDCEFDAHLGCVGGHRAKADGASHVQPQQQSFGHHRPQQRGLGSGLVGAVAQGFLSGMVQQAGQDAMQAILGDGSPGVDGVPAILGALTGMN